jgi:hypothetical protein
MVKTTKKPKIIRVFPGKEVSLGGVIYDDGRVFLFTYTKTPNVFDRENPAGEGFWSEMIYPDLAAFEQKDRPRKA